MKVFLVGYMGCGKSSVGKRLASKLKCKFIDVDVQIERSTGQSVSELFQYQGEEAFRAMEAKMLRSIQTENAVVATGGGCPIFENNMAWMKENGTTVYLNITAEAAYSRLVYAKVKRPLIAKLKNEELMGFIKSQLAERAEVYSQAEIKIPAINVNLNSLVAQLQFK